MAVGVTHIDIDEALRYMGCPPQQADPGIRALAEQSARELMTTLHPRWSYRFFPLVEEEGGVRLGGLLFPGQDLKAHLAGCFGAFVFCATLSAGVDGLLRRAQSGDMARALALDCCAAAAVENLCDSIELELQGQYPGCSFPSRFSPGYGDLPISVQGDVLNLLDAPRRVGLTATPDHILLPRKSVTAVLGVSKGEVERRVRSCLGCPGRESCQYRKSGGHCGIS